MSGQDDQFESLLDRLKRDVSALEAAHSADAPSPAPAADLLDRFRGVLEAALSEAQGAAAGAQQSIGAGAQKIHDKMKRHPAATVSGAFAAGYLIGKTIVGRSRK